MKISIALLGFSAFLFQAGAHAAECQDVGARLNALASADQQIRQEWDTLMQNQKPSELESSALQTRWRAIDAENLKQLKEILTACGWPREKKDSHSAWLLAQHADSDVAFQRQARNLLEASVKAGVGEARDLAYLADRIAANEGRPQEYGTQFTQPDRCHLVLEPVDSRELVNRRRLAIGLQSLEDYEAEGRRRAIPPDCAD
jgi:hypothetical protein